MSNYSQMIPSFLRIGEMHKPVKSPRTSLYMADLHKYRAKSVFPQDFLLDSVPSSIPALKATEVNDTTTLAEQRWGITVLPHSPPPMSTHNHSGRQNEHHAFTFKKGIWPQSCYGCQYAWAVFSNNVKQNLVLGTSK